MSEKLADFLDALQGLRKVLAFFALFAVAIIFRLCNLIDGGQFVDLMKNVTISFFAANGVEWIASTVKTHLESKQL